MDIFVLILLIIAALGTVMTRSLLRAAMGLALTSAILTVFMFRLGAPLAGVFELSVCTGLISVLFISTISLTEPLTPEQTLQHMKDRLQRFWYLPVILIVLGVALCFIHPPINVAPVPAEAEKDVRSIMWNIRQIDMLGQIIILLAGAFGVVVLLKERQKNAS
jgi:NADH-quinone oxidoreductase subunit J